jgi:23S rRNA pseudouridine2605 synthase
VTERIQKVLSQWGIASRRQAEKMILARRVKLNERIAVLGDRVDLNIDKLEVDGQVIQYNHRPTLIYLLLNKPLGVVSTCNDPQQRSTVIDLLPESLKQGQGIHPVGRLDINSSGALLLTNDGNLTLNLTHPRYHLPKTYHVWLDGCPTDRDLDIWRKGVMLFEQKTLPAKVRILQQKQTKTLLEIILIEGKNRQIRRVAEQLGFKVIVLHRIAIASITLRTESGNKLSQGDYRHLTTEEVTFLQKTVKNKSLNLAASNGNAVHKK